MTGQPAYPGYATPTFTARGGRWYVTAEPWQQDLGTVESNLPTGWTAWDLNRSYVGLFPDRQAAGEALVRHAGYEVLR